MSCLLRCPHFRVSWRCIFSHTGGTFWESIQFLHTEWLLLYPFDIVLASDYIEVCLCMSANISSMVWQCLSWLQNAPHEAAQFSENGCLSCCVALCFWCLNGLKCHLEDSTPHCYVMVYIGVGKAIVLGGDLIFSCACIRKKGSTWQKVGGGARGPRFLRLWYIATYVMQHSTAVMGKDFNFTHDNMHGVDANSVALILERERYPLML